MVRFWAERIGYDSKRIEEVPEKLRKGVKEYIESTSL